MKTKGLMIAAVVAAFVLIMPAFAQQYAVRASVPFDFAVGAQTLSAGEYRITISAPATLRIARIGGDDVAGMVVEPISGVENVNPRLIFHRYGTQYFLAEVWAGELNMGHQLFASTMEVQAARTTKQETATILAKEVAVK